MLSPSFYHALALVLLTVGGLTAQAAPANDECSSATAITLGTYNVDLTAATPSPENVDCGDSDDDNSPDVWFTFTPAADGSYAAFTKSAIESGGKQVAVFSGADCANLFCVAGGDDDGVNFTDATANWDAVAGTTYFIVVHMTSNQTAPPFQFLLKENPAAPNDLCATATVITPGTYSGSTVLATPSPDDYSSTECNEISEGNDVWFQFTPAADGFYTIATNSPLTNFDTQLFLLEGANCGSLTCLDQNDDNDLSYASRIDFNAVAGTTYFIVINPFDQDEAGCYELRLELNEVPTNDGCANALPITTCDPVVGSTTLATPSDENTDCGDADDGNGNDVWYRYVATGAASLTASTVSDVTEFSTQLTVFSGTDCTALTCVAGNDDEATNGSDLSEVTWQAQAGTEYLILVHGEGSGDNGSFLLTLVSDAGSTDCPVYNETLDVYYATIQEAIDAAPAGQRTTIVIPGGNYPEDVDFGNKEITVRFGAPN